MTRSNSKRLTLFAALVAVTMAMGPIYALIFLPKFTLDALAPVTLDGLIGGVLLWGGLLYLWPSKICAPLRRLAFPWHILFLLVLVAIIIPMTGWIDNLVLTGTFAVDFGFRPRGSLYLFVLAITTFLLIIMQISKVIGPRILVNLLIGRYHNPVEEKRIFLFVDLIGSTALASQHGDLGLQRLLTRFFFDLGRPVAEHGGEIHAYIGDEVIITWPYNTGAERARCVRCFFAVQSVLRGHAEVYDKMFGVRPRIRAGLHGGSVIVSECGDTKKSIVYFGDTMNTAARLEGEAKRTDEELIVSEQLLRDITLPDGIVAKAMGDVTLRGHDSSTGVFALSKADAV
ncbi:MAG: adenylate cyclase [Paracoccaceae bacterium]